MATLLLERGADITLLDSYNKSAVEYARKAKFVELADFLNAELKRVKDLGKCQEPEKRPAPRRKEEVVKEARHTYKLVHLNEKGESRDLTEEEVKIICADNPELAAYLANPETIPQDFEEDTWDKVAARILSNCSKMKGAFYFQEPVDPVKYNIMDYFDIISHPMDLGTVKKRLSHNFYQNAKLFVRDMNLIWNNSYQYNGPQHLVSKSAREVEEAFNQQIVSQGLDKYLSAHQAQEEIKKQQEVYQDQEPYQDNEVQDLPEGIRREEDKKVEREKAYDSEEKEEEEDVQVEREENSNFGDEDSYNSEENKENGSEDEYSE